MNTQEKSKVPFLKWAGGKRKILDRILALLPEGKRLIEPFSGSATVFLNTQYKKNIVADTNQDVINIFTQLQNNPTEFIRYCQHFFITENNDSEQYYQFREQFNLTTDDPKLRAALFLYLNKHGYNGLCRYNSKGGFNVPFGKYKKVTFPKDYLLEFSNKSQSAKFIAQDFESSFAMAKKGDVFYCDPPYVPLNASNTSFQYVEKSFTMEQQKQLAQLAEKTAKKGIPVLISNHLTDFTRDIYKNAELTTFSVQRYISCKGDKREKAQELLALFQ